MNALAVSPGGRWLATASDDRSLRLWDLKADDPTAATDMLSGHEGRVTGVTFTPDGRWLVSGSDDHTIRLWSLPWDESPTSLSAHQAAITSVAVCSDSQWLVTGIAHGGAFLWNLANPEEEPRALGKTTVPIVAVRFTPFPRKVVIASADGELQSWHIDSHKMLMAESRGLGVWPKTGIGSEPIASCGGENGSREVPVPVLGQTQALARESDHELGDQSRCPLAGRRWSRRAAADLADEPSDRGRSGRALGVPGWGDRQPTRDFQSPIPLVGSGWRRR